MAAVPNDKHENHECVNLVELIRMISLFLSNNLHIPTNIVDAILFRFQKETLGIKRFLEPKE